MKKLTFRIITLGIALITLSCSEDFLDIVPQQSVPNELALTSIGDFRSSITGVYNGLSSENYYGRYFLLVPDVMSDDVKQHPSANRAKDYAEYGASEDDFIAEEMWQEMWEDVNALNTIINSDVELAEVVRADQEHIIGEAYALRGLVYFDMVRAFAQHYSFTDGASHLGVPLVLEFDQMSTPGRNSVGEVYAQIVSDMNQALTMITDTPRSGSTATLSHTAVKALLARVYLYMDDLSNAERLATEVINSGKYTLLANENYADAWSGKFSSESIFEISMTETDNRGSDALGRMYIVEGYGDYLPSNDIVSLYDANDVRLSWFAEDPGLDGDYAPYRMVKYPSVTGENNTIVMRLSEVYLIRAEALARQGKNDAQADLDVIRQRADPQAAPVAATGDELLAEVLLEKRKELAFEGHRTWDLMRHKKDIIRTQCTSSICEIIYPNERVVMPIPEAELDANPNIQQNPGF